MAIPSEQQPLGWWWFVLRLKEGDSEAKFIG